MKRNLTFLVSVVLTATLFLFQAMAQTETISQAQAAGDDLSGCNALLKHGVTERVQESYAQLSASEITSHICQAYEQVKIDRKNGGVKVSYKLFGGRASYSSEQIETMAQFMCADNFASHNDSTVISIIRETISPAAMDAWRSCVSEHATGIKSNTFIREEDQANLILQVHYVPPVGTRPELWIDRVVVSPAGAFTCSGTLVEMQGKSIVTNTVAMSCERQLFSTPTTYLNKPVVALPATITVMTNAGTITRSLSSIPAPPAPDARPDNTPVGTVVAFFGSIQEAEALQTSGYWIADGRVVSDVKAKILVGQATPVLINRFLIGGTTSGLLGGSNEITIPGQEISFDYGPIPKTRAAVWEAPYVRTGWPPPASMVEVWGTLRTRSLVYEGGRSVEKITGPEMPTTITSKTKINPTNLKLLPPYYSVIYLIKVR